MLSSVGEMRFSVLGFIVQLSAVASDCLRITLLDILLKDLKLDSLSMLYYTAPTSAFFIGLGFIAFELPTFPWEMLTPHFSAVLLANGVLAFSLNLAVLFLISNTSAVVMSVSGPIKDILIVISSVVFFHAPVTMLQFVGFSISLFGLNLYRQFKTDPASMHTAVMLFRTSVWDNFCCLCKTTSASGNSSGHSAGYKEISQNSIDAVVGSGKMHSLGERSDQDMNLTALEMEEGEAQL
eukprot:gene29308-36334_t